MSYSRYLRTRTDYDNMCSEEQEEFEAFCDWLDNVEDKVRKQTGIKMVEMQDHEYRIMYEEGYMEEDVAEMVTENFRNSMKVFYS
jgi:hypothetical protein